MLIVLGAREKHVGNQVRGKPDSKETAIIINSTSDRRKKQHTMKRCCQI